MVIEDNKILKSMQEGTSQILQPLMNKKCLWLHMGILFTTVTGSLLKLHQNWRAEKKSTATITNMSCNGAACYTKTAAFLSEIILTRSLSSRNRPEPTGSKSHLLEVCILDLLLLLLDKTITKHSGSQFLQFCILLPAAAEL